MCEIVCIKQEQFNAEEMKMAREKRATNEEGK